MTVYINGVAPDVDDAIAVHAALTTAIHGVGALHIAGFHSAGQAVSKVVWKDASEEAMGDYARSADLAWTVLDLSAYVSSNAKFAMLKLQQYIVSISGGKAFLEVRKNGTTPASYPLSGMDADKGDIASAERAVCIIVGLDTDKKIQYQIDVDGTISIHSSIFVLGYIE